ncbi:MAG TPA: isoprenylcysteine carboxylmethyltransferase family protein [Candidatus Polarisedimenticolaceae bacterium]|nr:isoprenylcysteine carboxylmethyltransferase family protein [Candidatus Polarisedimenticolaceae bacterium]
MVDTYNRPLGVLRLTALYALIGVMIWKARPTGMGVAVGSLFVIAGEAVRFWAAGHLLKTAELVTSGPYRYTRNPLYLGRLLIFTGLCIMAELPYHANWILLLAGYTIFFGYYLPRKERVEPARLQEVHGAAYEQYRRAVPALFPTLRPFPDAGASGWSSDRMLRNREHWMVLGLTAIVLFMLWRANYFAERERLEGGTARYALESDAWMARNSPTFSVVTSPTRRSPSSTGMGPGPERNRGSAASRASSEVAVSKSVRMTVATAASVPARRSAAISSERRSSPTTRS